MLLARDIVVRGLIEVLESASAVNKPSKSREFCNVFRDYDRANVLPQKHVQCFCSILFENILRSTHATTLERN